MPVPAPGPPPDRPLISRAVASPPAEIPFPATLAPSATWPLTEQRVLVLALAAIVLLAATFRVQGLDYGGFSEDEVNKVAALRAYAAGNFTANAEHPMLMKLAMLGATVAADAWNYLATRTGWHAVSPEAALRLPNALVGAATVIPLFLLARSFFGPLVALWASLLLALDVTVTGLNRIGKEDTFLVFFLLLGTWLYEEARARHAPGGTVPCRWYAASGAAFGLMLASKYMIYYLGLWALFRLAAGAEERKLAGPRPAPAGPPRRAPRAFYAAAFVAFVIANPAILSPATWAYCLHYASGGTMIHHGAYFAGQIYPNAITDTPWGLPWHFYLLYLAVKIPLPILAAIGVGVAELVRLRRQRGAVFARVFLLFFLLPSSLAAAKFARYLLPALVVLQLVAALGVVRALDLVVRWRGLRLRVAAAGAIVALVVVTALNAQVTAAPFASLHLNAIGHRLSAPGGLFPNDELYDIGVREAVLWIAGRAAPGASVASDAPGVVGEYLRRAGRTDIEARPLSTEGLPAPPAEVWLLAQSSHACFESQPTVDLVRRRERPVFVYRVHGTAAVEVFHLDWRSPAGLAPNASRALTSRGQQHGARLRPAAWAIDGTPARGPAVLRAARYSLAGRVRPLLFWVGKDNVGEARIAWLAGSGEAPGGYELLIGSDPARAPRKINRWGYLAETEGEGEVQVVGLMTEVDHETLEQAKASVDGPAKGSRAYKVIHGLVSPSDAGTTVRGVMLPESFTFRDLAAAMEWLPTAGMPERQIAVPPGAEPGFLHAMASLLREHVETFRQRGVAAAGGSRTYVYGGKVYDVTIRSSKALARAAYQGVEYRDLIESEFQAKARSGGGGSKFKLAYGTEGPLREVPIRIVYRPKWWFEAEMVLVEGPGLEVPFLARRTTSR
ncbi:MAG TPA: glycosyltransferase family 39 protein [Vicinamibacterales bacterium]|nr:glycosyltransferase family 39 protein [Vicinamibacterales bacterium]